MPTCTIRLPDTWKDNLVTLRDSLPEALGQELIATLASRTPEQIEAMVRAMQSGGTPTALEATASTSPTPPEASTRPERLLNRPVPSALAGIFSRLLDKAEVDPGGVRSALIQATKFL
jgi:hypothetical protein